MGVDWDVVDHISRLVGKISPSSFVAIYCLNPLKDVDYPVGICPNPDIAGSLLRIARKFVLSFLQQMDI